MSGTAHELMPFVRQLREAASNYAHKHFPPRYNDLINSFCQVAQHDSGLKDFFRLCTAVVSAISSGLSGGFYMYNRETRKLELMCDTENGLHDPALETDDLMEGRDLSMEHECDNRIVYPLFSRMKEEGEQPEMPWACDRETYNSVCCRQLRSPDPFYSKLFIIGCFSVAPADSMFHEDRLFFSTLTQWMGTELNKRITALQNLEHLCFLSALGKDIGHDIIVPNMRFAYLFRQLDKQIGMLGDIERELEESVRAHCGQEKLTSIVERLASLGKDIDTCNKELQKQHVQISTFIENVFREEHFSMGRFVPRVVKSFVEEDVILPQLSVYETRFREKGISVERPSNMYKQDFPLLVDVGLLSQVYANLFSNAVKYTGEITDRHGRKRKVMAYGCEKVNDFRGSGRRGIKFNVFTTGRPLSQEECRAIFSEGTRGRNTRGVSGSGHGLAFIRRVIEVHGGEFGCEPTEEGNNFYFILPVHDMEED
jgi:signal transduction histidine kinase